MAHSKVKPIFAAIKVTTTSSAIIISVRGVGKEETAAAFSLQVQNVGAETDAVWTFTYTATIDSDEFGYQAPTGAGNIGTFTSNGAAGLGDIYSFSPKGCTKMKIVATLDSGTCANGLKVGLFRT